MITLSIVAAGIIALAAALLARPSPEPRAADQRGITLQTLIVTAVLVLMAVAAGVVIVAITNTQQERLEQAGTTDTGKLCERWEIHDVNIASARRGGPVGHGGIKSSKIGCLRVCYIESSANADTLAANEDVEDDPTAATGKWELRFSRTNRSTANPATGARTILQISGSRSADTASSAPGTTSADVVLDLNDENSDNLEVRVSPDQRYCYIWNKTTEEEEFRSSDFDTTS